MSRTPRITDTLPETQAAYSALERLAAARGISFTLNEYGAFRSESDTTDILGYRDADYAVYVRNLKKKNPAAVPLSKEKWRRIAPFGHSWHDYGAAFDISLKIVPRGTTADAAMKLLGNELAPQAGLRWGGAFGDTPHFELAVPLSTAAQMWSDFQARRGKYAAAAAPTPAAVVTQATNAVSDAADHAAAQVAIATEQLSAGGIPPIAVALVAAIGLGVLGAIVARRFGIFA